MAILNKISSGVLARLQQENTEIVQTTARWRDLVESIYISDSIFERVEIEIPDEVIENIVFYTKDNTKYLRFAFYDGNCNVLYNQDIEVDDDIRVICASQRFTQYRDFEIILNLFKADIVFC